MTVEKWKFWLTILNYILTTFGCILGGFYVNYKFKEDIERMLRPRKLDNTNSNKEDEIKLDAAASSEDIFHEVVDKEIDNLTNGFDRGYFYRLGELFNFFVDLLPIKIIGYLVGVLVYATGMVFYGIIYLPLAIVAVGVYAFNPKKKILIKLIIFTFMLDLLVGLVVEMLS